MPDDWYVPLYSATIKEIVWDFCVEWFYDGDAYVTYGDTAWPSYSERYIGPI